MRWRAPDQEVVVDQRGHGDRLCKKIAKQFDQGGCYGS